MGAFRIQSNFPARIGHLGFTLLELVLGIVIITFAGATFLRAFGDLIPRGPSASQISVANQLAQERMALIITQRARLGYGSVVDPCVASPTATPCVAPSGYALSVAGATTGASISWPLSSSTEDFRLIQVTVVETASTARTLATVSILLGNY